MDSQLLLGLYCIISAYCFRPIPAISTPSSTDAKVIIHGRVNYGNLDQVPDTASTATGQNITNNSQNDANRLSNVTPSKISVGIIKRSAQESNFPNEIHYSKNNDLAHSVSTCEDDTRFCNTQVFDNEDFQQMGDVRLANQMQWNKQEYTGYTNREVYTPGLGAMDVELPFNRIQSSNTYVRPPQDANTISDMYSQPLLGSNDAALPFNEPNVLYLIRQPFSLNHNMRQHPLTMSHDNAVGELEPIQEVKKNPFISSGWGPRGMPFNVLYMKPAPRSTVVRARNVVTPAPLVDFSTNSQHQRVVGSAPRAGGRREQIMRRQYPVLPQLFGFYSWKPVGK